MESTQCIGSIRSSSTAGRAMSTSTFKAFVSLWGLVFAVAFIAVCVPPLLENPDLIGAAMAGFVNPFSSGYALDAIFCWLVLSTWVIYEAKEKGFKHGWICILLGVAPGVATGFAAYLLLRMHQEVANTSLQGRRP